MEGKDIKVYGTLINQTLNTNSSMRDSQHNDLIAVAYQLYDERFNPKKGSGRNDVVIATDKYLDIINKRLTAISYDPNNDITNIYSNLYVEGDTNIGGDLTVEGDTIFEGDVNITGDINIDMGLNDLNDVVLSTMAVGQVLRYNGSKWVNAKLSIDDLQMPAATAGLVLKFNGTKWIADTISTGGGGATKLSELSDVDSSVDSATNGQVLKFNGTKWVAGTDNDTKNIDSILPAASEGLVLKYTNGHWVPGTDNTGGSGGEFEVLEVDATGTNSCYYYSMPKSDAYRVISAMSILEGFNANVSTSTVRGTVIGGEVRYSDSVIYDEITYNNVWYSSNSLSDSNSAKFRFLMKKATSTT